MGMLDEHALAEGARVADRCPHCERDTSLEVAEQHYLSPTWEARNPLLAAMALFPKMEEYQLLRAYRCMFCGETTLVRFKFDAVPNAAEIQRQPVEAEMVWPRRAPHDLPPEAPEPVRSLFREASVCHGAGALRGAAALLRACVEEIARDKGATGRNLELRINDLAVQVPALSADLIRDLHDARLTGNWSVHDGTTFTEAEVDDLSLLIESAVEVIYVAPARREALAAARTARRGGQAPPV